MKRALSGLLGALLLSGTLLASVAAPQAAQADHTRRHRVYNRTQDRDRDGIPDYRDTYVAPRYYNGRYYYGNGNYYGLRRRDADGDGIRNRRDRDIDGDGIRNRRDRDRDGDGVRNRRDDHPKNPRRR